MWRGRHDGRYISIYRILLETKIKTLRCRAHNGNEFASKSSGLSKQMINLKAISVVFACVTAAAPAVALAGPNLVVNGDFEQTSMQNSQGTFTPEEMNASNVTGWSTNGYNFIFGANTATTLGSNGSFGQTYLYDGSAASGGAILGQSPTGGNFVGADGAFQVGAITQILSGLTKGTNYAVSFSWAGAQQSGYTGATTEQWQVSLGSQTQSTQVASNANHGFTGWMQQTFVFQATTASEVLSFLAIGTPNGEPPFSLLDGVSATDVPEPASFTLMAACIGILGLLIVRQRNRRTAY